MNHLGWGLQMAAVGMGLVFGLLILLWGLLVLVLKFDRAPAAAEAAPEASAVTSAVADPPALDPVLVAAITLATLAHRAHSRLEGAPAMRSFAPGSQLHASRWVAAGRVRQNQSWVRRGRG